jgi:uncharacterized protein (TIGR02001 family)
MMKTVSKSLVLGSVLAASMASSAAMAGGLTGNVGIVSDYFFRGIDQGVSSAASAGVDYDFGNGVAIGTWGADVGDGIEYDLYGSYSGEAGGASYSVGFTTYRYTGEFDDTYNEINLGAGFGPISLELTKGTYDTDPDSEDYTFVGVTLEQGGAYLTYGSFGEDADGSYIEAGYGMEAGGFDVGVALISADDDLSQVDNDSDGQTDAEVSMVFSLGKTFDL